MKKQILFSFLLIFFSVAYAQEKIIWDYPVKLGTKEWVKFETTDQMVSAILIPLNVLHTIGTKELVAVCLDYPLFNNYIAFNDERLGVKTTIKQFNGFQELSKRKDGVAELIKAYAEYPVLTQLQSDVNSKDYHVPYKLPFLELLLSDSVFLNKMTYEELEELRKVAVNKYTLKMQNSEVYSLFNVKKTMLLSAVVMDKQHQTEKSKQGIIRAFIQNYNNLDTSTLTKMSKIIR